MQVPFKLSQCRPIKIACWIFVFVTYKNASPTSELRWTRIFNIRVPFKNSNSSEFCWDVPTDPFHTDSPSGLPDRHPTLPTDDCRCCPTEYMSVEQTLSPPDWPNCGTRYPTLATSPTIRRRVPGFSPDIPQPSTDIQSVDSFKHRTTAGDCPS